MTLDRRKVETALKKKGFKLENRDHRFYFLYVGGIRQVIYTKISTGREYRTLGYDLVGDIATQMKLRPNQLRQFVACKIWELDYLALLRAQGVPLSEK